MRQIYSLIIAFFAFSFSVFAAPTAVTAEQAAKLYEQKDYVAAANAYGQLLADTTTLQQDAQLFAAYSYNAANCHYRLKNYAEAVYGYQQALRLSPSDKDAAFNLQLAQSKLVDQFNEPSQMIFSLFFRSVMLSQSATAWGSWALVLLVICFVLGLSVRLLDRILWRKILFGFSAFALVCSLGAFLMAYVEQNAAFPEQQAVLMQGTLQTYSSPSATSQPQRELHEGVLLNVEEVQPDGWMQVTLPDNTEVWTKPSTTQLKRLR